MIGTSQRSKNFMYVLAKPRSFNQPLDKWDTSVRQMAWMFRQPPNFNQNIGMGYIERNKDGRMFEGRSVSTSRWMMGQSQTCGICYACSDGSKTSISRRPLEWSRIRSCWTYVLKRIAVLSQSLDMWLIPRFCDTKQYVPVRLKFTDVKTLTLCFHLATKVNCRQHWKKNCTSSTRRKYTRNSR